MSGGAPHAEYAIIVAGGKGVRMGTDVPKQFLPINGLPVLMRTIVRFREYDPDLRIIIVLPKAQHDTWHSLCRDYHFTAAYAVAEGGETRFHSVRNGLALIPDDEDSVVAVHDGVRPFPSVEVIARCFAMAREKQAVVPVVPVVDTLRHIDGEGGSVTVPRSEHVLVQTPQTFVTALLKQAFQQPYCEGFTDDASVVEAYGQAITLVEGNRENIKITTPYDLRIAKILA